MKNKILYTTRQNKVIVQKYLRDMRPRRKKRVTSSPSFRVHVLDVKLVGNIYIISLLTYILFSPLWKEFHSTSITLKISLF